MEIRFLGHAAFELTDVETDNSSQVVVLAPGETHTP
jgi:hypothetical protein